MKKRKRKQPLTYADCVTEIVPLANELMDVIEKHEVSLLKAITATSYVMGYLESAIIESEKDKQSTIIERTQLVLLASQVAGLAFDYAISRQDKIDAVAAVEDMFKR